MSITYISAKDVPIEALVQLRCDVLRTVNHLPTDADFSVIREATRAYYDYAFDDESCIQLVAMDGQQTVGTGAACIYAVMPTWHDPTGRKAYLMNMYVAPAYRRQGIATELLHRLTAEVRARGIDFITLEATAMGRPVYERFGFVPQQDEMILP